MLQQIMHGVSAASGAVYEAGRYESLPKAVFGEGRASCYGCRMNAGSSSTACMRPGDAHAGHDGLSLNGRDHAQGFVFACVWCVSEDWGFLRRMQAGGIA